MDARNDGLCNIREPQGSHWKKRSMLGGVLRLVNKECMEMTPTNDSGCWGLGGLDPSQKTINP